MTMEYLRELSEAIGVSGDEGAARTIILKAIEGHVEDVKIDAMGTITALKRGTDGANRPRVMLAAHMDEVLIGTAVAQVDHRVARGTVRVVT